MLHPVAETRAFLRAALVDPTPRDHHESHRAFRRRRVVSGITLVLGAAVLTWALHLGPGDNRFYLATIALAVVWIAGALISGPLHLGHGWTRTGTTGSRAVVQSFAMGAILVGVFAAGALAVAPIPTLREPVQALLAHASEGSLLLVALVTAVNGIAEELFFRGALYAAVGRRHPVAVTTAAYALVTAVLWLRRDLRSTDHPALLAAAAEGDVVPLFVIDPTLWEHAGAVRRAWIAANVQAAADAFDGRLCLRVGRPDQVVPEVATQARAGAVHTSRETTPGGVRRDARVRARLECAGVGLVETGSPYAVGPGLVRTRSGTPFKVFTPFARAWRDHGWPAPAEPSGRLPLAAADSDPAAHELLHRAIAECPIRLPPAGEDAALARWAAFRDEHLGSYGTGRDRPDLDATSHLSADLKTGAIHPRTLLADLGGRRGDDVQRFVTELAWREFYADVLWHHPGSAWGDLRPGLAGLAYDSPKDRQDDLDAWRAGRTGYPFVDAGMRQLAATGWMHNRVRMVTASFLTKDLHQWWPVGARHFMAHLIDADLASNNHGWQWVAGTGTDAAPYFRVFNPVTQGKRFDPDGDYVRRWVPELRHLPGAAVHEPWRDSAGHDGGYPERIVDHAQERREALARYEAARS